MNTIIKFDSIQAAIGLTLVFQKKKGVKTSWSDLKKQSTQKRYGNSNRGNISEISFSKGELAKWQEFGEEMKVICLYQWKQFITEE